MVFNSLEKLTKKARLAISTGKGDALEVCKFRARESVSYIFLNRCWGKKFVLSCDFMETDSGRVRWVLVSRHVKEMYIIYCSLTYLER